MNVNTYDNCILPLNVFFLLFFDNVNTLEDCIFPLKLQKHLKYNCNAPMKKQQSCRKLQLK
jgi:hypothetical protein